MGNSESSSSLPKGAFPGTRWSLIIAARDGSDDSRFVALSELCEIYWYPIYSYLRRSGKSADDAEDITQGFFLQQLRKEDILRADPDRGKMRSFLLGSLKHFVANTHKYEIRQKRGGPNRKVVSIEQERAEERFHNEPVSETDPVKVFDQQWAVSLLNRVFERLKSENTAPDQALVFEKLSPFLAGGNERGDYKLLSSELSQSEGALRVIVHRLRKRYRQILEEEVLETLSDPAELEEELHHLLSVFT